MSGLKREIAERMELVVQFEPSISLHDVFELALKNEKEERIYVHKIICEFMKNESVEVIEVVNQQSEEFPSSFEKTLEKETNEVKEKSRKEECQVETSPPKTTFEDSCINQQSEEFPS